VKDMTGATQNVAKQIRMITDANIRHSEISGSLLDSIQVVRGVTDHNAADAKLMHAAMDVRSGSAHANGNSRARVKPAKSAAAPARSKH
jgi:hypothetical protein